MSVLSWAVFPHFVRECIWKGQSKREGEGKSTAEMHTGTISAQSSFGGVGGEEKNKIKK